jgi:transcriptional regulator with XRE-family HTH domain
MEELVERPTAYGRKVGERLRAIRRQKNLSLQDVESTSNEEFKASVLGAYERGERAISVPRLQRLAAFYHVPVDQLLPPVDGRPPVLVDIREAARAVRHEGVTIDLLRLRDLDTPAAGMLTRFLETIQVQRQDFNGRMLTVRRDDLGAVACILETTLEDVRATLDELGLALTT